MKSKLSLLVIAGLVLSQCLCASEKNLFTMILSGEPDEIEHEETQMKAVEGQYYLIVASEKRGVSLGELERMQTYSSVLESLVQLEKEGVVVSGGNLAGKRMSAFIVLARDHFELSKILGSLDKGILEFEVSPLIPFEQYYAIDREKQSDLSGFMR